MAVLRPNAESARARPDELQARTIELCPGCVSAVWKAADAAITAALTADSAPGGA